MKINKFIGLLACAMAFTACQNDMLEADMQQNKIYTLSGKMLTGKAMSRAQVELGNSNSAEEYAYWNEGDAFALYQNINDNLSTSVFTISGDYIEAGENPQSATFTTDNPAELGVDYVAVYPAGLTVNNGRVDMNFNGNHLDFSGATSEAERAATWKGYMNRYMYMLANGKLVSGGLNVVSFQHLCAMFRVTYSNETEATKDISSLSFTGDMFSNGITYDLNGRYQTGSGATDNYSTSFSGLTVQPGETVDLYVFLFPHELNSEGEVQVNLNINSTKQTVALPSATIQAANGGVAGIEAGKRYWFKVTENAEGLVWNKDLNVEKITIKNVELSAALLNVLGSSNVTLDENGYAVINEPVVNSITKLDFNSYDERANITSLDGIEDFVSLEELYIDDAGLTTLKLSNPKLCKVSVASNKLTSVDVSGLSNLYYLSCAFNGELRGNMNLQGTVMRELRFQHTNATAVPEGLNPSELVIFDSGDNQLTELDFSEFTFIRDLYLARNQLTNETLLLPENNLLEILDISGNGNFTSFDLTQSPKLRYLWASGNLIDSLDTSKCPELNFISCHDNMLTALDLTANENLSHLECGSQKNEINLVLTLTEAQKEKWDNSWANSNANVTVVVSEVGSDDSELTPLEAAAKNGGTYTLTENTRIYAPLVVEADLTLDLSTYWIGGCTDESQFVDSDGLKTLIAVKPGATLTILGNQLNTGQSLSQYSAIKLLGGGEGVAKVVVNSIWICGTYYGIEVAEDCQHAEIEINDGRVQGDFNNAYQGSGIFNPANAKITINGGTVDGHASAIEMRGGELIVNNGQLQAYQANLSIGVAENASTTIQGAAIAVAPEDEVTVTIAGGSISTSSAYAYYDNGDASMINLSITGGCFDKEIYSANCTGFVSGGQFAVQPQEHYMIDGKTTSLNGSYYEVVDGESTEETIVIENPEFAAALQAVLGSDKVTINEDSCAVMKQSDVYSVTELDFYQKGLTSLEGLEEFVNLESFIAGDCYLSGSVKVTNSKLRRFDVFNNDITSLDVSGLSQLEILQCSENKSLGNNINIEGTNLTDLQFYGTGASSLDFIPQNLIAQIENFDCRTNNFTSLDLSAYISVKNIWISSNGLTELILPKTETLELLDMSHNTGILSVDLTIYPNLKEFYNQQNNLESIDVSKCPELWLIYTNGNKLTELDLSNNPKVEHLYCDGQQDDRILTLILPETLMDRWNNEWKDSFVNVVLGNELNEE